MPADSRTGIESRIVLSRPREVKMMASVLDAARRADYGVEGFGEGMSARFVSVT